LRISWRSAGPLPSAARVTSLAIIRENSGFRNFRQRELAQHEADEAR
jgi:hypothetical protein